MYKRILVPLDGSPHSEQAFAAALNLAHMSGAEVTLLTVVLAYRDAHVANVPKLAGQTRRRAEAYLAPFVQRGKERGCSVAARVGHGDPAEEIVAAADDIDADVVVMSTHGIGASGRHALGSVAMKVLEKAGRPVLMVPVPHVPFHV